MSVTIKQPKNKGINPNLVGLFRVCFEVGEGKITALSKTRQNYTRNLKFGA